MDATYIDDTSQPLVIDLLINITCFDIFFNLNSPPTCSVNPWLKPIIAAKNKVILLDRITANQIVLNSRSLRYQLYLDAHRGAV